MAARVVWLWPSAVACWLWLLVTDVQASDRGWSGHCRTPLDHSDASPNQTLAIANYVRL
jgi:hypothetical protein